MRVLAVGGKFDDQSGKPSGYIRKLFESLSLLLKNDTFVYINGGSWDHLTQNIDLVKNYDVVLWFCEVDNNKPKLLPRIKELNPSCVLVSSKSNIDGKYSFAELIARSLKSKSNLFVEFTLASFEAKWNGQPLQEVGRVYAASIFDPLGNVFLSKETDPSKVATALMKRVWELTTFTRVSSKHLEGRIFVPDDSEFFDIVRKHADKFHELIHGANQDRLLGNISFRCESGFPSFRHEDVIFVSQRNIDKRNIGPAGCVAVSTKEPVDVVGYYGDEKPSVDTPIQLALYQYYPNVWYMLHSHVYVEGAPFTKRVIPCGAVEEVDEIIDVVQDWRSTNFAVNLRGHGSIVFAYRPDYLKSVKYYARPIPEQVE